MSIDWTRVIEATIIGLPGIIGAVVAAFGTWQAALAKKAATAAKQEVNAARAEAESAHEMTRARVDEAIRLATPLSVPKWDGKDRRQG